MTTVVSRSVTARRYRWWQLAISVLAALGAVVGLLGANDLAERQREAAVDAQVVVDLMAVAPAVLLAHSEAAASLTEGSDREAHLSAFKTLSEQASAGLFKAAAGGEVDGLVQANRLLLDYQASMVAVINGSPAASTSLTKAGEILHDQLIPALKEALDDRVSTASQSRVTWAGWAVPLGSWLLAGTLFVASVWVARRSHRLLNPGLGLALLLAVALGVLGQQAIDAQRVPDTSAIDDLTPTVAVSTDHAQLTARQLQAVATTTWTSGDATAAEDLSQAIASVDTDSLTRAVKKAHTSALASADQITTSLADGDWKQARSALLDSDGQLATVTALLEEVSLHSSSVAEQEASSMGATGSWLTILGFLLVGGSALAAVAGWWGLSLRLREYR